MTKTTEQVIDNILDSYGYKKCAKDGEQCCATESDICGRGDDASLVSVISRNFFEQSPFLTVKKGGIACNSDNFNISDSYGCYVKKIPPDIRSLWPSKSRANVSLKDAGFKECAKEGGVCTTKSGKSHILYGVEGKNYAYAYLSGKPKGSISCSNSMFGDPVPGNKKKKCWSTPDTSIGVSTPKQFKLAEYMDTLSLRALSASQQVGKLHFPTGYDVKDITTIEKQETSIVDLIFIIIAIALIVYLVISIFCTSTSDSTTESFEKLTGGDFYY